MIGAATIAATPAIAVLRPISRGDAALLQDDAEQRQSQPDRYADRRDRANGGDQRRPMDFLEIARCAVSRLRHICTPTELLRTNAT